MPVTLEARKAKMDYGCEFLGRLESALLHAPGEELAMLTSANCRHWMFPEVPDAKRMADEHRRFRGLLEHHGVKIRLLEECASLRPAQLARLPSLLYLQDVAVVSRRGAILSRMARPGRRGEETVVREALRSLGIPVWIDFPEPEDAFEGCLLLSPDLVLVAESECHRTASVFKFIRQASRCFPEILYVDLPENRRFTHPGAIFNRVTPELALAYLPAFHSTYRICRGTMTKIDFKLFLQTKAIDVVGVSEEEQKRMACSFLPLDSGVILHEERALARETRRRLEKKGVSLVFFTAEALLAGGGSLRRLVLQLHRRGNAPVAERHGK